MYANSTVQSWWKSKPPWVRPTSRKQSPMSNALDALDLSVKHLRSTVEGLSESQYVASAYPTEWTVAHVMSNSGTDALDADRALLAQLLELTPEERDSYALNLGPMKFDFDRAVRLRLGEHVLHTWDIDVTFDPQATLQSEAVPY